MAGLFDLVFGSSSEEEELPVIINSEQLPVFDQQGNDVTAQWLVHHDEPEEVLVIWDDQEEEQESKPWWKVW